MNVQKEEHRIFNGVYLHDQRILNCRIEVWKIEDSKHLKVKCYDARGHCVMKSNLPKSLLEAQIMGGTFWENFTPLTKVRKSSGHLPDVADAAEPE